MSNGITFRQTNPTSLTTVHDESQMVISPPSVGGTLQEIQQTGSATSSGVILGSFGIMSREGAFAPM